jgi:tetratricopeptide (TPR) repeat protein
MTRDAVVFGIAGACFGIVVGWIFGSQQGSGPAPPAAATQRPPQTAGSEPPAPELDVNRVMALEKEAKARPTDAAIRAEIGNLYYDARRFEQAIPWYEESLKINPRDINVSTDLAVMYYYSNNPDRALEQIAKSLAIDPAHVKTLLNQGIIQAFGKQDFAGAQASWDKVIQIAPSSAEAERAKMLKSAHGSGLPETGAGAAPPPGGRGGNPEGQ